MNYISFLLRSALIDFSRNKGRTILTSLGILIGVMAVVLLMALGLGLKKYISNQFDSLGANLIYVIPGNKKAITSGSGMVGGIKFDEKDIQKVKKVQGAEVVAPVFSKPGIEIEANGKSEIGEIAASTEEINIVMNLKAEEGRLIEHKDVDKRYKGIVISAKMAVKLFKQSSAAIGESITIEGQIFKVIGVYKSKGGGGMGGQDMDALVFIPGTAISAFNPDKKYYALYIKAKTKEAIPELKINIQSALLKRYEEKQFSVMDQGEIMSSVNSIFNVINVILVSIAAISLVVGGIGIMNVMYITVSERIREIGIRRALGAQKKDILYQFLVASVLLSVMGGLLGIIFSYLI
ncbi:MAG: ABC transporter permease, partial [Candidatus Roizmanbacteria bacterium]|nr:ABC transporter permease [Candidatus Roizmanbacteria bacterium]